MKDNKGFTLIEVLAILVIMSIIAVITVPIITNIINNAKLTTYKKGVDGHVKNIEYALSSNSLDEGFKDGQYDGDKQESDFDFKYPDDDNVKCESYKINGKTVYEANYCSAPSWPTHICYKKGEETNTCDLPYKDASGANRPEILDNMVAVKYNGTSWIVADTTKKWYDYNAHEWANAVILNDSVKKKIGDVVSMDDISMMYVWIPRFKYTVFNGNDGYLDAKEIEVSFEFGTSTTGDVKCHDFLGIRASSQDCSLIVNDVSTYTHPAFTFGDKELTGIWVGKFENSTLNNNCLVSPSASNCDSVSKVVIKPSLKDWRFAKISTFYNSIKNISKEHGINNGDSHLIKNMDWGAVAFLTHSKYGIGNSDMQINNNPNFITGCGNNTYNEYTCLEYNSTEGVLASTTANVYGLYDMSGGAWEYVMGAMVNQTGDFFAANSGFSEAPDKKYLDYYSYDASSYVTYVRGKLGDATKEVLFKAPDVVEWTGVYDQGWNAWYNDFVSLPHEGNSWMLRGGHYGGADRAGLLDSYLSEGDTYDTGASRSVITKK